jgi:hypothetical protein
MRLSRPCRTLYSLCRPSFGARLPEEVGRESTAGLDRTGAVFCCWRGKHYSRTEALCRRLRNVLPLYLCNLQGFWVNEIPRAALHSFLFGRPVKQKLIANDFLHRQAARKASSVLQRRHRKSLDLLKEQIKCAKPPFHFYC